MSKQPAPRPGTVGITPLVITDLLDRARNGLETYGTPLQAHNGRDALQDAYDEALDLAQYLRQEIEERHTGRTCELEPDCAKLLDENKKLRERVAELEIKLTEQAGQPWRQSMSEIENAEDFTDDAVRRSVEFIGRQYVATKHLAGLIRERDAATAAKARLDALRNLADEMDALDAYCYIENQDENTKHLFPDVAVGVGDRIRAMIDEQDAEGEPEHE